MKIIAYIFLVGLTILVILWLLRQYILRYFLRRFEKKMQNFAQEQEEDQEQTIIGKKSDTSAENTDFKELN